LVVAAAALPAPAQNNGKQQDGQGKYAALTADWWDWVLARPAIDVDGTNTFPILDSTGAYAAGGQEQGIGPGNRYFFLAGTFGVDATRTVAIPRGKALFFPVINYEVDNANSPPTQFTVPQLRAIAKANIDTVIPGSLYANFDGAPVEIFRTTSPAFPYTLPDQNSIYEYFGSFGPQFQGRVQPVVADGYWAYIAPPPPGQHVLNFGGALTANGGLSLNVTYFLTIP
jgi:hypothetical protein